MTELVIPDDAPPPLVHYLHMWNERDPDVIRPHLDRCVADDCLWVDPLHQHVGRDALEENVRTFRTEFPDAVLALGSNIDSHNGRHRYEWVITVEGGETLLMRGFDVATVNDAGMIDRVDGFFGMLQRFGPE
ncbi:MAG: nuclear transport factor 2 family protein [Acidimicrobiales bacterium]|nr:nuclear transport factor 2 family protein [Acidimicrobiales bacterium]